MQSKIHRMSIVFGILFIVAFIIGSTEALAVPERKIEIQKTNTVITGTGQITYGSDVPVLSFTITPVGVSRVSVNRIAFSLEEQGLNAWADGITTEWKLYRIVDGTIDYTYNLVTQAQIIGDEVKILNLSVSDNRLGSAYTLQVFGTKEFALVGSITDDGVDNFDELCVTAVDRTTETFARWEWRSGANFMKDAAVTWKKKIENIDAQSCMNNTEVSITQEAVPSTEIFVRDNNAVAFRFAMAAVNDVEVQTLTLQIEATNNGATPDAARLIDNNTVANFTDIKIEDHTIGEILVGPQELDVNGSDTLQTLTFTDHFLIAGGETKYLDVTFDVRENLDLAGQTIQITLNAIDPTNGIMDSASGTYISNIDPATDLVGESITVNLDATIDNEGLATTEVTEGANDFTGFSFGVVANQAVTINSLQITIASTTTADAAVTSGARLTNSTVSPSTANFTDIKIIDRDTGTVVMGPQELRLDNIATYDVQQTLTFTDSLSFTDGEEKHFDITFDVANNPYLAGQGIKITLKNIDETYVYRIDGSQGYISPDADLIGNEIKVQPDGVVDNESPGTQTVNRGANDVVGMGFGVVANRNITITQLSVTFQSYTTIDATVTSGARLINSTVSPSTANFTDIKIIDRDTGTVVMGPVALDVNGSDANQRLTFTGSIAFSAGQEQHFDILFDVADNPYLAGQGIKFQLTTYSGTGYVYNNDNAISWGYLNPATSFYGNEVKIQADGVVDYEGGLTTVSRGEDDARAFQFGVVANRDLTITKLALAFQFTTTVDAAVFNASRLVNTAVGPYTANFIDFKVIDYDTGEVLMGPVELDVNLSDSSQTMTFTGNIAVSEGEDRHVGLVFDVINNEYLVGEGYKVTLSTYSGSSYVYNNADEISWGYLSPAPTIITGNEIFVQ